MESFPIDMTATAALRALRGGQLRAEVYVRSHLDRIERREPAVKAWAFLDPEYAVVQARHLDRERDEGRRLGPPHGVPVGMKDIFDTA